MLDKALRRGGLRLSALCEESRGACGGGSGVRDVLRYHGNHLRTLNYSAQ